MNTADEARLAALDARVRALEDQVAIYQLIATYGPAVDSLAADTVEAMWTADGVYDPSGSHYVGGASVGGLVAQDLHQSYVTAGCAHVLSLPVVHVDGDTAVAVNHSRVYVRDGGGWTVARVSANRWELVRGPDGWRVARRTGRLLDGDAEARDLLHVTRTKI